MTPHDLLACQEEHVSAYMCRTRLAAACRRRPDNLALGEAYAEALAAQASTAAALIQALRLATARTRAA
ncbi:hypothetical protein [uncultured Thiodictyon sp.]|uniref:hypothetical protein n=1 Tax=uncultured Thiodictyon sp. TaxID=1846217 RepID=UPI0025ED9519|nr:hypothetical protein [uncultured Thiodictyon sp.]